MSPTSRLRRRLLALLALSLALSVPAMSGPPAAQAATNTIDFGGGRDWVAAGPNAVIKIDGSLEYDDDCFGGGVKDFVWPASDVYVVPTGTVEEGDKLTDVSGAPNTIVAPGTMFIGEVIAITTPSGSLGAGEYDVVYDTCQDGKVDFPADEVFEEAIVVPLYTELPGPATQTGIKQKARAEYESWRDTRLTMRALNILATIAGKACAPGAPSACVAKAFGPLVNVQDRFDSLLANMARHYDGIAHDPPDADFRRATTLTVDTDPLQGGVDPHTRRIAELGDAVAAEGALAEAFLHAMERYQGAQQQGDAYWALVHARQAANLASVQAEAASLTTPRIEAVRQSLGDEHDPAFAAVRAFHNQVGRSGFDSEQRRHLLNQGLTPAEVLALETELVTGPAVGAPEAVVFRNNLQRAVTAHAATVPSLQTTAAAWSDIAGSIATGQVQAPHADAGTRYDGSEVTPIALDASASTAPAGTSISGYAWDLDGDGAFDDAAGPTPSAGFTAGVHVVGVEVATGAGQTAVGYAIVSVADVDRPPVVSSALPDAPIVTIEAGASQTFSVSASDPEGDPTTVTWTFRDRASATGASHTVTPTAADLGSHTLTATVSDGTATGGATTHSWRINVIAADADGDGWSGNVDCDDSRADVHPGATELAGNEVDDDCDAGTPDIPPGGAEGRVVVWGSNVLGTGGNGGAHQYQVPTFVEGIDDAAQVDTSFRAGFARRGNGTVLSWGSNFNGELGHGKSGHASRPAAVVAVGGAPGSELTGVTQISAGGGGTHILARRHDGSAVAWGDNPRGALGDGSTVSFRNSPVVVLATSGEPLRGVKAVEAGGAESFAILDDGSVVTWGATRCMNGPTGDTPHPIPFAKLNKPIAQISSSPDATMFLAVDGEVLICGSLSNGYTPVRVQPFGPGSGIVQVETGGQGRLALDGDGRVFAWGRNTNGELDVLGVPPSATLAVPTPVPLPEGPEVVSIAHDDACHVTAVRTDGSAVGWGCNSSRQVGSGSTASRVGAVEPVAIPEGVVAVAARTSSWNSIALVHSPGTTLPGTPVPTVELPEITVGEATLTEGAGGGFPVALSKPAGTDVTVTYQVVTGTAESADLDRSSGEVVIPAGESTGMLPLAAAADGIDEPDEDFTVTLQSVTGAGVGLRSASGIIVDGDPTPVAAISAPATVSEGSYGTAGVVFTISLSAPSAHDVRVAYEPVPGTASVPGDVQLHGGEVWLAPGTTDAEVHVAVVGDTELESDETFGLRITAADHATADPAPAVVTIVDDEPIVVDVASPEVTEGNAGATRATFSLTARGIPAGGSVTIGYTTMDGTATAPSDYSAVSGEVILGEAVPSATIDVTVNGDTEVEIDEVFRLSITSATGAGSRPVTVGDAAPALIRNDDTTDPGPDPDPDPEPTHKFLAPVTSPPKVNEARHAGSKVPLKWSLDGDRGLAIIAEGYPRSIPRDCETGEYIGAPQAAAYDGRVPLSYHAERDEYRFIWRTDPSWAFTCRAVEVLLTDGTLYTAWFAFQEAVVE